MKITKVEVQKKNKQRYSIYIEDTYAFSVHQDLLVKFMLLKGEELNEQQIEYIKKADSKHRVYQVAIHYLSSKMRTEKEVRDKLLSYEILPEFIDEAIEKLKKMNYLNDAMYASAYVRTAIATTKKGPYVIRTELLKKGVHEDDCEEALEQYTYEEQFDHAYQLADRQVQRLSTKSPRQAKQQLYVFLMRKGYSGSLTQEVLSELSFDIQKEEQWENVMLEGQKILRRYQRKYEDWELVQRVKRSLYQKGYDGEYINQFINQYVKE